MNLFSRTRLHLFENYRCARTSNLSSSKLSCLTFFFPNVLSLKLMMALTCSWNSTSALKNEESRIQRDKKILLQLQWSAAVWTQRVFSVGFASLPKLKIVSARDCANLIRRRRWQSRIQPKAVAVNLAAGKNKKWWHQRERTTGRGRYSRSRA